eukprot:gnl/TRDRNA2_/TRDRNA2_49891_c0_seq1.p1 gnl/TRDRNA2_/TRDRNA2_49891_c0~~gnl/TRDRNA2_/TRDRNA2_49891_c0_seq1.p1  ORF type:complete len:100 (+),score=17.90 gnl/TRDRNA2_/TRDRNA2_49891_c0_seq1:43-300(+)
MGPGGMTGSINQKLDTIIQTLAEQKRGSPSMDGDGNNVSPLFRNRAKLDDVLTGAGEKKVAVPALDLTLPERDTPAIDSARTAQI